LAKNSKIRWDAATAAILASLYFLYEFFHGRALGGVVIAIIPAMIIGFILGWLLFPLFISRSGNYHYSAFEKLVKRLLFGFAWSGCITLATVVLLHYLVS